MKTGSCKEIAIRRAGAADEITESPPQMVTAKILRYDPACDEAPHYETYEIAWKPYLSVMELLVMVYEQYEDVAFDYGCRGVWCGRCGMNVNGRPVLACMSLVKPGKEVKIEPLKGFPVIRDMIVDRSKVSDKLRDVKSYLLRQVPMEEIPNITAETYKKMCGIYRCTDCLLCYPVCPPLRKNMDNVGKFCGPAALLKIGLRHYDPRDEGDRVAQAVEMGLEHCTLCGACHKICDLGMESAKGPPNSLGPAELFYIDHDAIFGDLRKEAEARGLIPPLPAKKRPRGKNESVASSPASAKKRR